VDTFDKIGLLWTIATLHVGVSLVIVHLRKSCILFSSIPNWIWM